MTIRSTLSRAMARAGYVSTPRLWVKKARAKALELETAKNVAEVMAKYENGKASDAAND